MTLRMLRALLLALPFFLGAAAPVQTQEVAVAAARTPDALVSGVARVGYTVSDLDRAVAFFTKVLDFQLTDETEIAGADFERLQGVFGARARIARLRLGDEEIELTEYLVPRGRPIPVDSRSNDGWFQHIAIIVSDMDKAYARLREHRVEHASSGPQRLPDWNPNAGGIQAFYFKDPDGHVLEILQFPAGKGQARWQRKDRLFLGIDHTAIVVRDTDRSLAFYRDVLGLKVAGESENHGTEQEHLNNVFGARLRITALRANAGPAIELLEYLAPRDGRPYPVDARASDLLHWQTTLIVSQADATERALRRAASPFISPGIITLNEPFLGFRRGLTLRDPDGHALEIIQ